MRNLIYWFFIALLIAILFGSVKKYNEYRKARKKYNEFNKKYVESLNRKKELDRLAAARTGIYICCIYGVALLTCYQLRAYFPGNPLIVLTEIITAVLFVLQFCGLAVFGQEITGKRFYEFINNPIKKGIYNKYDYNPHLLPVYSRKREEAREEVFKAMAELRKRKPVWKGV